MTKIYQFLSNWRRRFRLAHKLRHRTIRHGMALPKIKVVSRNGTWRLAEIRKDRHLRLLLSSNDADQKKIDNVVYRERLPVAIYAFSQTSRSIRSAWINLDDDNREGIPNNLTFCASSSDAILVPDPEFFNTNAYESWRKELPRQRPWRERQDLIVWRGATTGRIGSFPDDRLNCEAADVLPRIRMCALLKAVPDVDAKIYTCVQTTNVPHYEAILRKAGLFGDRQSPLGWIDRKFAIDIDGNGNAWSNLFSRLLFGCCVIKVGSPQGFKQWYYDRLEPWKNYVPVRADLTDMADIIEWCRTHEQECSRIASAGQDLARSMGFEVEMQDAVRRINERLG